MDEYKGRIFGKSVLEATFRSFYGTDLFLGELLAAEDPERSRRFLFRVIQVTFGSDSSDPNWAERTAGAYMSGDAAGTPYTLRDPEQRLYKVATCSPLGYIDPGGEFRKPKSLPAQFARVTAPTSDDFAFLRERMGDLGVGFLRSGEDTIDLGVGIRGDTLTSHVGVFATTGMGKSNLMKVLAGAILESQGRYACLLFDPHGEYHEGGGGARRGLRDHPWAGDRLRVYATRRGSGAGYTALQLSLGELTLGDLQTAYEWSRAQEEAIYRLERLYREEWLPTVADEAQDPQELAEQVGAAPATLQVVQRRARRILDLPCISRDPSQPSLSGRIVDELSNGYSVLVETSGLSSMEEILVASVITRRLLDTYSAAFLEDREAFDRLPPTLVALEEAQRVLARVKRSDENVFPRVAREGRKFRVGLCAVSQQPKLIDDELLSQFNTFFILGLADEKDRNILRASSKQDISDLGPEIQTLMPGEAIVTNLEAPFALPARLHLYEEYLKSVAGPAPLSSRPEGAGKGFAE
ncbi:MAG TPA: ATP-binding protein [Actinomycetota bacterium]|jgi:DNA helicase HerA-like ATPase|nr:ATP-binding protein [Actinomycetota bacterium]